MLHRERLATTQTKHGEECSCPGCGAPGRFERQRDVDAGRAEYWNWIRLNPHEDQFECYECYLK